jgi:K+-sensing histidine kinase KdpD
MSRLAADERKWTEFDNSKSPSDKSIEVSGTVKHAASAILASWARQRTCYGVAILAVFFATLLRKVLDPVLLETAPFSAYYAAVMVAAWYGGLGPGLVALFSGAFLAVLLFVEPHRSLFASNLEHQVGLGLYIAVGIIVAALCESLHGSRRKTDSARRELAIANGALQKEIAEHQQAERWLLESEQRFRGCFERAGRDGHSLAREESHRG